jgi:tubulin polyglutamylase TTLL6/13
LIKKNAIRDTLKLINLTEKVRNDIKIQRDKDIKDRLTTGKRKKWTDEERVEMGRQAQH